MKRRWYEIIWLLIKVLAAGIFMAATLIPMLILSQIYYGLKNLFFAGRDCK